MAKGYILVEEVPKTCIGCMFDDMGFCQAVHEGGEYIPDEDIDNKPDWCPIQTWIPVTKQKPSNKDDVSVTLKDGSRDTCWYSEEFDEWYDGRCNKKDVVAWIPFGIEPYEIKHK